MKECILYGGSLCRYHKRFPCRYGPAKKTVLATPTTARYYKLADGNILDIETKTILNREVLKTMLDG